MVAVINYVNKEVGWIRTNDGYPIDLQSIALDHSATTSLNKKTSVYRTITLLCKVFQLFLLT